MHSRWGGRLEGKKVKRLGQECREGLEGGGGHSTRGLGTEGTLWVPHVTEIALITTTALANAPTTSSTTAMQIMARRKGEFEALRKERARALEHKRRQAALQRTHQRKVEFVRRCQQVGAGDSNATCKQTSMAEGTARGGQRWQLLELTWGEVGSRDSRTTWGVPEAKLGSIIWLH